MLRLGWFLFLAMVMGCSSKGSQPYVCEDYPSASTSSYILPFEKGESFTVSQSNCSSTSHFGNSKYAYDFSMPMGTKVIAARAGEVLNVKQSDYDNNPGLEGNYINILHEDGTVASYRHLSRKSVMVQVGDLVGQGDQIALSGNSGKSTGPHLHFVVWKKRGLPESIPITFSNVNESHEGMLKEKQTYSAK